MVYEYECTECSKLITVQSSIAEMEEEQNIRNYTCPECKSPIVKIMSRSTFVLKGGGWARDGYSTYVGDAIKSGADIQGRDDD